ncbi:RNA polymerase sigma-70 factor, ECF subfamily [Ekhidna lutea]|uniref:RNA polymerase sigma-70 factor, ECF subfamily n=2 Tax=Ekhidna lutea TaxID=447679 RepID=A0A239EMC6_EKHLU|nr:RNA polymerase sigma-70 factor, ECF subfamily [Ekhidna lutea]
MSLVKAGQLDYLNELFSRYSKRIYNYFLKSTLERAESDDLTQELFIRVMKYRNSYKEGHSVQFWIFQIARNMIKDHFRKMKIHKDQFNLVEVIPEREDVGDDELFEREKKLHRAMKELSDEKRELLVLSKFQGMKYEQIAKMRDTTVSNIKVQVHRTIKELKEAYFQLEEV